MCDTKKINEYKSLRPLLHVSHLELLLSTRIDPKALLLIKWKVRIR